MVTISKDAWNQINVYFFSFFSIELANKYVVHTGLDVCPLFFFYLYAVPKGTLNWYFKSIESLINLAYIISLIPKLSVP